MKNIFLTGHPRVGKTTVIKKIIELLSPKMKLRGFYTEEVRVDGNRIGFKMKALNGKEGILGHKDVKSPFTVSNYGVCIEDIESVAVPSLIPEHEDEIVILDEIGRMECFSEKFNKIARFVLDSKNTVIGTITISEFPFVDEVRKREDVEIIEVTEKNRDELPGKIAIRC